MALRNDNIRVQSGIAVCDNTSSGHTGEIYVKLRGETGGIGRTETAMLVQVLYLKNIETLAPHGHRSLSLLGFVLQFLPSNVSVFIALHHLFPEAEEHLCTDENVPQVRRPDSRLSIFYTFQDHCLSDYQEFMPAFGDGLPEECSALVKHLSR